MSVPERTIGSLASVKRIPVFAISDPSDSNPYFWITDNGLRLALGINYDASFKWSWFLKIMVYFGMAV